MDLDRDCSLQKVEGWRRALEGALKVLLARPHCLCRRGPERLPWGLLSSQVAKHRSIAGKERGRHSPGM